MKHAQCLNCHSYNTRLDVDDESVGDDGDEIVYVFIRCLDCKVLSPFDTDDDWRDYV